MNLIIKLIILLQLSLTLTGEVCAQTNTNFPSDTPDSKNSFPIILSADHIKQGTNKDNVMAWGRVKVQYQKRVLWADRVIINNQLGTGKAQGHVILEGEDGTRMKADETFFDLKSKQGKLFKSKTIIGNQIRIKAKEIARLSANHFSVDDANLTTCKGVLPAWKIEAKSIDIKTGDRALFREAILKIKDFPILYIPVGYLPMDTKRKSGFLFPTLGWSEIDGILFDQKYFWAINRWSDATFNTRRVLGGWEHGLEYRYVPSTTSQGTVSGNIYKDNLTGETLWKTKAKHTQELPNEFKFKGSLDLESRQSLNRVINNNTEERTRRSTDSYASVNKSWENSSIDILTRYRKSTDPTKDDTFGELPKITYKLQQTQIGKSPFFFNLNTSSAWFLTDLKTQKEKDFMFKTYRLDFHPQLTLPLALAPWMTMTTSVGARETFYSKGLSTVGSEYKKLSSFSRESLNIRSTIQGPKINKVYHLKNSFNKIKHLLEPKLTLNFVPDIDENDRLKIKTIDSIDTIGVPTNTITYAFGQRLLKKFKTGPNKFKTKQILRFNVSQTYNIREATRQKQIGEDLLPFSDIFFDIDSRLSESIIFNTDLSYDVNAGSINSFNFEAGIKPVNNLWVIMERRWMRNGPNYILGTLDMALNPGWRIQYSTRFDELTSTFRENQFSLLYDNPCKCWGFSFDIIDRHLNDANVERQDQTQFLWTIKFRGLGDFGTRKKDRFIHRDFEDTTFPDTTN